MIETRKRIRKDKKRNMSKVAKVLLRKPLLTQEQVAKKLGLWEWTVNRAIKELEENGGKIPSIIEVTNRDLYNIVKMQERVFEKVTDDDYMKWTRLGELAMALKEATARYTLFRWTATNSEGWLNQPIFNVNIQ